MSLKVSFPGRYGDLLWALPTVRAMAEHLGTEAHLYIAGEFASIAPLIEQQPYIRAVTPLPEWTLTPPDEWKAPVDAEHLGYRRWPEAPLPYAIAKQAGVTIDLTRPWITTDGKLTWQRGVAVGFTEAWFELKLGLLIALQALCEAEAHFTQMAPFPPGRWALEGSEHVPVTRCTWDHACFQLGTVPLFFGDCSALHVLACAMGKKVLLMEPMEARWNTIFYPYGQDGPQVTLIKGLDGRPTFDARHCAEAIKEAL